MKAGAMIKVPHNPFDETCRMSRLRESLTSGSDGEGLETSRASTPISRHPFTRQTFYNDFKTTMQGNKWHCQTLHTFELELVIKMILACLIRLAMTEAAKAKGLVPGHLIIAGRLLKPESFLRS